MAIQLVLFDCEKQEEITVASTEIVIGRDSILQVGTRGDSLMHKFNHYLDFPVHSRAVLSLFHAV